MKIYRYEVWCEGEPQDVGFLVGIEDLGLSVEKSDYLYSLFDNDLIDPIAAGMRDSVSFFTQNGHDRFRDKIAEVISAYDDSIFDIIRVSLELPGEFADMIIYEDNDQVCIPRSFYHEKLFALSRIFEGTKVNKTSIEEKIMTAANIYKSDRLAGRPLKKAARVGRDEKEKSC